VNLGGREESSDAVELGMQQLSPDRHLRSAGRPPYGTPVSADGVDILSIRGSREELVWQRQENSGTSRSDRSRRNPMAME
jgi:hypothetical protein